MYITIRAVSLLMCSSYHKLRISRSTSKYAYVQSKNAPPFNVCAAFPWHMQSLDGDLFGGQLREEKQDEWQEMVRAWGGSILVGSHGCIYIIRKQGVPCYVKVPRPNSVSIALCDL